MEISNLAAPASSPARHEYLEAGGLANLIDELAHGLLVVGLDGRVMHANLSARQELSRRGLPSPARLLQAMRPAEARPLQDALARASDGKRSLINVALGEGPPLALAVIPLRSQSVPRRVALVFARASICESLMLCFFARSHGLTHTEENVLAILCQGYSAPEVARQLKVAVSTVRSHVRSLCAKTRTSGVRELVRRVALLPPVAPSLWQEPVH